METFNVSLYITLLIKKRWIRPHPLNSINFFFYDKKKQKKKRKERAGPTYPTKYKEFGRETVQFCHLLVTFTHVFPNIFTSLSNLPTLFSFFLLSNPNFSALHNHHHPKRFFPTGSVHSLLSHFFLPLFVILILIITAAAFVFWVWFSQFLLVCVDLAGVGSGLAGILGGVRFCLDLFIVCACRHYLSQLSCLCI